MDKKLKILYLHGFASAYNPDSAKIKSLSVLGDVAGFTINYARPKDEVEKELIEAVQYKNIDLIVGCSLGGFHAINVGAACGVPVVALNPSLTPQYALREKQGKIAQNYVTGEQFVITPIVAESYEKSGFRTDGCVLVLT